MGKIANFIHGFNETFYALIEYAIHGNDEPPKPQIYQRQTIEEKDRQKKLKLMVVSFFTFMIAVFVLALILPPAGAVPYTEYCINDTHANRWAILGLNGSDYVLNQTFECPFNCTNITGTCFDPGEQSSRDMVIQIMWMLILVALLVLLYFVVGFLQNTVAKISGKRAEDRGLND